MATGELLSLPSTSNNLTPATNATAWLYGAWVEAVSAVSNTSRKRIVGIQFQVNNVPVARVNVEVLIELGIGASGAESTKIQIPYSIKSDTAIGYYLQDYTAYLPEMYTIEQGNRVAIRVAASSTGAVTYDAKILYQADNSPTVVQNTANAQDFGTDTTPTLEFTGTDFELDNIRYNVQIQNVPDPVTIEQTLSTGSAILYGGTAATAETFQKHAQSFTTALALSNVSLELLLAKGGTPTDNLVVEIATALTGGTVLGTANIAGNTLTDNEVKTSIVFSPLFNLAAATTYYIRLSRSGVRDLANIFACRSNNTSGFSGIQYRMDNTAWVNVSPEDFYFKIIPEPTVPIRDKVSNIDAGFINTVTGGDTDPFNSGEMVSFTVQTGNELSTGTYYWKVRGYDPTGSNEYGSFTPLRTFTLVQGSIISRLGLLGVG